MPPRDWKTYQRNRRAAAHAKGLCGQCSLVKHAKGRTWCQGCLDKATKRRAEYAKLVAIGREVAAKRAARAGRK